jgi:hypothetical protein
MLRPRLVFVVLAALLVAAVPSAVADNGTGLTASVEADGSTVDLSWTTAVAGQTLTGPNGPVPGVDDTSTSATDSVDDNGTTYDWTLSQPDGQGGTVTDTVSVDTQPGPVSGLVVSDSGSDHVTLSWQPPGDPDLDHILVYRQRGTCPASGTLKQTLAASANGWSDTHVAASTTYCYRVVAEDVNGNDSPDATVSATTAAAPVDTTPPGPVTGLAANTDFVGQVGLTWTNPSDSDLSYVQIYRRAGTTCPTQPGDGAHVALVDVTPGSQGSTTDGNVVPGQQYCYAAWAYDSSDNASVNADTIQARAKPSLDTTPPGRVSALAAVVRAGSVQLRWSNPSAPDLDRVIVRRDRRGCPAAPTDGAAVGGDLVRRSQTDRSPRAGRNYCYSVFAVDASGNASSARSTHSTVPPNVRGVTAAAGCTRARIAWRNPSSSLLVRVRVVRNAHRAPRDPGDGRLRQHRPRSLLDKRLHHHTRYSYRLYTIYRSSNPRQRLVYSTGTVVRVRTGNVCAPLNGGSAGRRPKLRWQPHHGARRYAIRVSRRGRTLLLRYPFHASYRVPASWRQGGHRRSLQRGNAYQLFVYAYTARRPQGVLIAQSTFHVR